MERQKTFRQVEIAKIGLGSKTKFFSHHCHAQVVPGCTASCSRHDRFGDLLNKRGELRLEESALTHWSEAMAGGFEKLSSVATARHETRY